MIGGAYLCYEGFEAIKDKLTASRDDGTGQPKKTKPKIPEELAAYEKKKIAGAVRTDFILSAEIITLNIVTDAPMLQQVLTLVLIAVVMTVGVYGLVAGIVRLDDAGLILQKSKATGTWGSVVRTVGGWLLSAAPKLMKALSWIGTVAMFLVGGAFITEGIEPMQHFAERLVEGLGAWETVAALGIHSLVGALVGMVAVPIVNGITTISGKISA
jgi:predicted DNA repair protein MutK